MEKILPKLIITLLAGVALGFGAQSVMSIGFKKMRTASLLAEARGQVIGLNAKVQAFKAAKGRYPKDAAEMAAAGFWRADELPVERLKGSGHWATDFDGEGGFLYLSATGQVFLNTDLKREKLRRADIELLKSGTLVPLGTFF
jgi:hypothetical protein